ncbi:hypothetical protein [Rummeliibacillus sp. SL167]
MCGTPFTLIDVIGRSHSRKICNAISRWTCND